jgi:hypothetical protein
MLVAGEKNCNQRKEKKAKQTIKRKIDKASNLFLGILLII